MVYDWIGDLRKRHMATLWFLLTVDPPKRGRSVSERSP